MMTFEQFKATLSLSQPDLAWAPLLKALWYDAKGDWNAAHDIADGFGTTEGDWVHAYLHRKEGDDWNANYWYRRAGKSKPYQSLDAEWEYIVRALLK